MAGDEGILTRTGRKERWEKPWEQSWREGFWDKDFGCVFIGSASVMLID